MFTPLFGIDYCLKFEESSEFISYMYVHNTHSDHFNLACINWKTGFLKREKHNGP